MKKINILTLLYALFCYGAIVGCSHPSVKVNGTQSKVTQIIDGKTVQLQNGLKVELLGIKGSEHTKKYLEEQVKGKVVTVISDSHQKKQTLKSYKTKVKAYIKVKGDSRDVAGKMLAFQIAYLNTVALKDSLDSFSELSQMITGCPRPEMTTSELATYIKPATFYIETASGKSGTGFFIDKFGKAMTCNHVLDGTENAAVCFFGEDGTIDRTTIHPIKRILLSYTNEDKIDFTVFQVDLDNGEEVAYLPMAAKHVNQGDKIAKMGCPLGYPGVFATGDLSTYNAGYFTHSIPTNNGDSGGPVVNMRGEVIGINQSVAINVPLSLRTGSVQMAAGIGWAVDVSLIREVLDTKNISYGKKSEVQKVSYGR